MNAITPCRFSEVLAKYRREQRFELRASLDGYQILERGRVIVRFEGPQLGLASRLLCLLREDAAKSTRAVA